jgi:hypothetical protein
MKYNICQAGHHCMIASANNKASGIGRERGVIKASISFQYIFFFLFLMGWDFLSVLRPLLAYFTSPRWLWRNWWNEDWQGKSEVFGENLPQRHFVYHKFHMTRPEFETGAAAVGSQRLTAWAMARPFRNYTQLCNAYVEREHKKKNLSVMAELCTLLCTKS